MNKTRGHLLRVLHKSCIKVKISVYKDCTAFSGNSFVGIYINCKMNYCLCK